MIERRLISVMETNFTSMFGMKTQTIVKKRWCVLCMTARSGKVSGGYSYYAERGKMAYKIVFDEKLLSCLKISICRIDREETYKTINMVKKSSTSDLQHVII